MPNLSPLTLSNVARFPNHGVVDDFTLFLGPNGAYTDIKTFTFTMSLKLLNFSSQTGDDIVVLGNGNTNDASGFSFAIVHDPLAYHNGLHTNYGVIVSNGTTTTTLWLDRPIPKNVLTSVTIRYQRKGGVGNNTLSLTVIYHEGGRLVTNQATIMNAVLMQQNAAFSIKSRRLVQGWNNTLYRLYFMSLYYYWVGFIRIEELFFSNTQVQANQYPMTFDRSVPNIELAMPFDRSGYTLANFGNMLVWWNASDQSLGTLTTLTDSTGNGKTISQNTTARKPTIDAATGGNVLTALSTRFMNTPGGGLESVLRSNNTGFTVVLAGGASRAGTDITLLNIGTVSQTHINIRVSATGVDPSSGVTCYSLAVSSAITFTYSTNTPILNPDVNHIIVVVVDFATQYIKVYINGAQVIDGYIGGSGITNADATTVSLFTNNSTGQQGRIYHLGIYGEAMSLANVYNVNNYIVAKHSTDFPYTNWKSGEFSLPGTTGQLGSTPAWSNLANLVDTNHGSYATQSLTASQSGSGNKLLCRNFGFAVGTGLTGIEMVIRNVDGGLSTTGQTLNVQLTLDGTTGIGDLRSFVWTTWTAVSNVKLMKVGGVNDMWGTSLTASDVANPNFGVLIYVVNNATAKTIQFDYVKMNVYNIDIVP